MSSSDLAFRADNLTVSNWSHYLLLFLLWPFLALIISIVNYSSKESKFFILLFFIYYGLTFYIGDTGADAEVYADRLLYNSKLPFSEFFNILKGLYTSDSTVDIAEPFVSFVVSRFTGNHGLYFAVWATVFGIFYLKSINLLHKKFIEDNNINAQILIIFFIGILPITTINSVRMWTAAWLFFYGAYHVVLFGKTKYLIITALAIFIHWSFLAANLVLFLYYFLGNRNILYSSLLLLSFSLRSVFNSILQAISIRVGGGLQRRVESYTDDDYVALRETMMDQTAWFIKLSNDLLFYYLIISVFIAKIIANRQDIDNSQKNLFSFLLLFLAFVNFGRDIPSFGGRFEVVFYLFAVLYLFNFFINLKYPQMHPVIIFGLFPMLLFILINFRIGSDSINPWIFLPGFGLPFMAQELSLAELIFN